MRNVWISKYSNSKYWGIHAHVVLIPAFEPRALPTGRAQLFADLPTHRPTPLEQHSRLLRTGKKIIQHTSLARLSKQMLFFTAGRVHANTERCGLRKKRRRDLPDVAAAAAAVFVSNYSKFDWFVPKNGAAVLKGQRPFRDCSPVFGTDHSNFKQFAPQNGTAPLGGVTFRRKSRLGIACQLCVCVFVSLSCVLSIHTYGT